MSYKKQVATLAAGLLAVAGIGGAAVHAAGAPDHDAERHIRSAGLASDSMTVTAETNFFASKSCSLTDTFRMTWKAEENGAVVKQGEYCRSVGGAPKINEK